MDVAIVTCATLPNLEPFDAPLLDALRARGLDARAVVWSDESVDWSAVRVAVIRSAWDTHLRREEFLQWAERAARATRLRNPVEVLRWNLHKRYLHELHEKGIPVTPTLWASQQQPLDLATVVSRPGWSRGVFKPAVSAGARETHLFSADNLSDAQMELGRLCATHDVLVQPYLQSFEVEGERSYVFVGGTFSHAVERPPSLLAAPRSFPAPRRIPSPAKHELALAERVLAVVGAELLYARVDLAVDNDGVLRLQEAELTEPCLFLALAEGAPERMAAAIEAQLG